MRVQLQVWLVVAGWQRRLGLEGGFSLADRAIYLPILAALTASPAPDSLASWQLAAYIAVLMPVVTWRVYLPSAVIAGLLIAAAVRHRWPLTVLEKNVDRWIGERKASV